MDFPDEILVSNVHVIVIMVVAKVGKKKRKIEGYYCKDCDVDVDLIDERKFPDHTDHSVIKVYEGDSDPSLIKEFKDRGLSIEEKRGLPKKENKEQEKDSRSVSKKLYDFAIGRTPKLVINENNTDEVYAVVTNNGHVETFNLGKLKRRLKGANFNVVYARNFMIFPFYKLPLDGAFEDFLRFFKLGKVMSNQIIAGRK